MNNNQIFVSMVNSAKESAKLIEKLFAVAQPSAVYGEPVISNNYTVITASEVAVGMGFGYGMGGGSDSESNQEEAQEPVDGGGGGGGGGGYSTSRPVAVISIGPSGVDVEPVVDATKIVMAIFMTIGSMFMMWNKMRKAGFRKDF